VVIVGGGVSGLAAAWRLAAVGIESTVVELEPFVGGTSAFGTDGVIPYPWGAHYLAAPNPEARATLRLLQEIGTLTGWDAAGRPRFDSRTLCHAPQERLFYNGDWHPGLVPGDALTAREREEMARFADIEHALTARTGSDGRAAFQIPLDLCSRDPELLRLDRMSMSEWLDREGFRTPFLRWYVRYATLDDYGALPENVSAWAGLHYFAARKLQTPELDGSRFLVWPEGNGRLVQALLTTSRARLVTGALVTRVLPSPGGVQVHYVDAATRDAGRINARAAIVAIPAFIARRIVPPALTRALPERTSSPWLVANLHVTCPVDPDLPWDSVLYDADGLGYVDARHQLTDLSDRTVLTYYRAYGEADTAGRRTALARAPWEELASGVLRDLAPAHPLLREQIERMDIMLWGHGMPRPCPGFLGETPFDIPSLLGERIAWAHVDQAGMALFEEAQARGVKAAEAIAGALGKDPGETWL
jgi:protoporphyrinogen oxidase